jgi:arylsulfatase A-like enzyme
MMWRAVAIGVLGGVVFGAWDTGRVAVAFSSPRPSLVSLLGLALYACLCDAVAGVVFLSLVGFLLWAACRRRDRALPMAQVTGLLAGILALAAFWIGARAGQTELSYRSWGLIALCLLSGVGLGVAVRALRTRIGPIGLLSAGVALTVAVFVTACWGCWVFLSRRSPSSAKPFVGYGLVGAMAVLLAVATYRFLASVLQRPTSRAGNQRTRRGFLAGGTVAGVVGVTGALEKLLSLPIRDRQHARAGSGTPRAGSSRSSVRPNILWIILDTARADALSSYGYARQTTPALDAIAREGVLYENAYSPSGWTLPAHASMFTGTFPSRHGATMENLHIRPRLPTVAEVLASRGYRTLAYSNNGYVSRDTDVLRGFRHQRMFDYGRSPKASLFIGQAKASLHLGDYGAKETNDVTTRWMSHAARSGEPFFLFINYMDVHRFYGSTPGFARWLTDSATRRKALAVSQSPFDYAGRQGSASDEDYRMLRTLYDGDMSYLDARVGELVQHLRKEGMLDNTLLVITSDHGEEFGEHDFISHHCGLYNTLLHVPLLVRYPDRFPPATRVKRPVQLLDIFPTILDVTRLEWPGRETLQGRSLLAGPQASKTRCVLAERAVPVDWLERVAEVFDSWERPDLRQRLKSIQAGGYKYVWGSAGYHALYDLGTDPQEKENLFADLPDKAKELDSMLRQRFGADMVQEPIGPARQP